MMADTTILSWITAEVDQALERVRRQLGERALLPRSHTAGAFASEAKGNRGGRSAGVPAIAAHALAARHPRLDSPAAERSGGNARSAGRHARGGTPAARAPRAVVG